MDKFLTFAGTQPVYLGDVDFMQASAANTFKQLARALMDSNNAILQGVTITRNGDNVTFSPGIVVLNGEILPFEGATLTTAAAYYFHVESTLSGARTFKNGESHDCYETRKAVINTTSSGGIEVDACERLHKSIDGVYPMADKSGIVKAGRLTVKENVGYLRLDYSVVPGGVTTGTLRIVVDPGTADVLRGITLPVFSASYYDGDSEVLPFTIYVAGEAENVLIFNIECKWTPEHANTGACYVTIPFVVL